MHEICSVIRTKIIKIIVTRYQILIQNAPNSISTGAPPQTKIGDPQLDLRGLLLREGNEGKGRKKGKRRGVEGKGREGLSHGCRTVDAPVCTVQILHIH